jgi:hypothetical protein
MIRFFICVIWFGGGLCNANIAAQDDNIMRLKIDSTVCLGNTDSLLSYDSLEGNWSFIDCIYYYLGSSQDALKRMVGTKDRKTFFFIDSVPKSMGALSLVYTDHVLTDFVVRSAYSSSTDSYSIKNGFVDGTFMRFKDSTLITKGTIRDKAKVGEWIEYLEEGKGSYSTGMYSGGFKKYYRGDSSFVKVVTLPDGTSFQTNVPSIAAELKEIGVIEENDISGVRFPVFVYDRCGIWKRYNKDGELNSVDNYGGCGGL